VTMFRTALCFSLFVGLAHAIWQLSPLEGSTCQVY